MVGVVAEGVLELAYHQVLAVITPGWAFRCHAPQFVGFKVVPGLHHFPRKQCFLHKPYLTVETLCVKSMNA